MPVLEVFPLESPMLKLCKPSVDIFLSNDFSRKNCQQKKGRMQEITRGLLEVSQAVMDV